jgi:acetyltransferase-like isoleucine patch superfamily enzyme
MNKICGNKPPLCEVHIFGDGNIVSFGNTNKHFKAKIYVGWNDCPAHNVKVVIGEDCFCNGMELFAFDNDSTVTIGNDCLFGENIHIWASDTHTVIDPDGNICNIGKNVNIGNHVWIGKNATILKNTSIADNSIVGTMACVHGNFKDNGSVIVGNPAKCVKTGYTWDFRRPNIWMKDMCFKNV